jgi:hypothetical protein
MEGIHFIKRLEEGPDEGLFKTASWGCIFRTALPCVLQVFGIG